jgi:FlaA1/EpsC-like NDP-sugar epimerase
VDGSPCPILKGIETKGGKVKGTAVRDTSGTSPAAERAAKTTADLARVFRVVRRLGIFLDALAIFAALAVALHIESRTPFGETPWFWGDAALSDLAGWKLIAAFGGFAVVLLWTSSHHYKSVLSKQGLFQEQRLNLQDCAVSGIFLVGALYLLNAEALSRGFVLLFLVLVAVGLGLRRLIFRMFPDAPTGPHNVLIIGADSTACALREQLRDGAGFGYAFKGFVKLSDAEPNSISDPGEVVGTIDKLAEHVCKYSVNGVFITASCSRKMTLKIVRQARELGVEARMLPGHLRFGVDKRNRSRI